MKEEQLLEPLGGIEAEVVNTAQVDLTEPNGPSI